MIPRHKQKVITTDARPDFLPALDKPQHDGNHLASWWSDFMVLGAILIVSAVVRVTMWRLWGTGPIETEGAEYARIAENLRKGIGYVGMSTPGTELMFPPFFPLLISGASFLTDSYVRAARCVALAFGALLPLPVFGIASRLFSRRTAFVAAVLAIAYPLLISLSLTVYSEGPYATLFLVAVYLALCALSCPSMRMWCLVGAAFGLAFLVRQEAFAALLVAAFFALTATRGKFTTRCMYATSAILIFLSLATPEIIFIYHSTGKLRLEAKSSINLPLAIAILAKGATNEADYSTSYGIDENLNRTGIFMRPNSQVVREANLKLRDVARLTAHLARRNTKILLQYFSSRWMGAPFLTALALLGALRRPWRKPLASSLLFLALIPMTSIVATFTVMNVAPRYFFLLIPFLLILAANGLVEIGLWMNTSLRALRLLWVSPLVFECIVFAVIGMGLLVYPTKDVRNLWEFLQGSPARNVVIDVGQWIRQQQPGPVRVMDNELALAFHADAEFVWFPYCSAESALLFLDAAKVDYVILHRGWNQGRKYYDDWLTKGIPDSRAQLVYTSSGLNPEQIVVYRWHWADKPSSGLSATAQDRQGLAAMCAPTAAFLVHPIDANP